VTSPDQQAIVDATATHVRQVLAGEGTGHDWWHVERVWRVARRIAQQEQVDLFVVDLAALLHDIADWKFHGGDESAGTRAARAWLEFMGVDQDTVGHVCGIVHDLSFRGANVAASMGSREGMVVQDADRLDALGAIGIARAFAYGGFRNRPLYDPGIQPQLHDSFEAYKRSEGTTINHFYEKLVLLKDRMHTPTGRQLAEERHQFMLDFLQHFFDEWEGRA
jgi:uncharacterized protein